jgi:Xaa-Pro aminopeptidase
LIARSPLWEDGLDYRHGTGHGVGHFLNVHEGPQSISSRISSQEIVLKPGMIVSNGKGKQKKEAKMNDEKKRARRK